MGHEHEPIRISIDLDNPALFAATVRTALAAHREVRRLVAMLLTMAAILPVVGIWTHMPVLFVPMVALLVVAAWTANITDISVGRRRSLRAMLVEAERRAALDARIAGTEG